MEGCKYILLTREIIKAIHDDSVIRAACEAMERLINVPESWLVDKNEESVRCEVAFGPSYEMWDVLWWTDRMDDPRLRAFARSMAESYCEKIAAETEALGVLSKWTSADFSAMSDAKLAHMVKTAPEVNNDVTDVTDVTLEHFGFEIRQDGQGIYFKLVSDRGDSEDLFTLPSDVNAETLRNTIESTLGGMKPQAECPSPCM